MTSSSVLIFLSLFIEFLFLNSLFTFVDCGHEFSFGNDTSSEEQIEEPTKCSSFISRQDVKVQKLANVSELDEVSKSCFQYLRRSSGYFKFPQSTGTRFFYYFFRSEANIRRPVIIWLGGGPGRTNNLAVFYGNGPFRFAEDSTLSWNTYGWHKVFNMLYVDQPVGVGFSNVNKPSDMKTTRSEGILDLYHFVRVILFSKYPEYNKNDLYIGGESYLASYAYGLAFHIHMTNIADPQMGGHINLEGVLIGNPLIDLASQHASIPEYARQEKLLSDIVVQQFEPLIEQCKSQVAKCREGEVEWCRTAFDHCNAILAETVENSIENNIYYLNIREPEAYSDYEMMYAFLNACNGAGQEPAVMFNSKMYNALTGEWAKDTKSELDFLLNENIKILIYAGKNDLLFNYKGTMMLYDDYLNQAYHEFWLDRDHVGRRREAGSLTFVEVFNAGNMVCSDQPLVALQMLMRWINNTW